MSFLSFPVNRESAIQKFPQGVNNIVFGFFTFTETEWFDIV